jgi:hypothetical protein
MIASNIELRWWLCCWDHIFEHAPVPDGEELCCPETDLDGPCRTNLIYAPYRSRADAEDALLRGASEWAPWVH